MTRNAAMACAVVDSTLIPIDRVADQKPCFSGKHRRHRVNVQVIADAARRLIWTSPALPGVVHDLTAARAHGLIDLLTAVGVLDPRRQGAPRRRRQRPYPVRAPR